VPDRDLMQYCLAKPGAWEDEPWEGNVVVKVGGKIFAFIGDPGGDSIGLKCATTRDEADEWITRYPDDAGVMPYIGRSGWNTLRAGRAIATQELLDAIDFSYDWAVSRLPKRERP